MPTYTTFDEYQRSLDCLAVQGEPLWQRIRAAFEAGQSVTVMTDKPLTHEVISESFVRPVDALSRIPDGIEIREAKRLLAESETRAHRAFEKVEAEAVRSASS